MMAKESRWKFPLILFVISCQLHCAYLISNQSHLCEPRDMSCGPERTSSCQMKYYVVNSTSCRDLAFNGASSTFENTLGEVLVQSYYYTLSTHRQTGFNVSFSRIHWKSLKFRYQQDGNELKNTCREFTIAGNATLDNLFYDCIWSLQTYEGKSFFFEYEASNGTQSVYEKFAFKVPIARYIDPYNTKVDDWELFTYTNVVTNGFGLTTFVVYWQPMPKKFNISAYNISVVTNDTGVLQVVSSTVVSCTEEDYQACKYFHNKWYGNVQFGVQPMCTSYSVECTTTRTQVFLLGGESTKPMLICIVSITITIPVVLYLIFLMRNYIVYKSRLWIKSVPKLLIIYSPSISSHVDVVFALAKYLKGYCNVEPMVDEWDIPCTKSKDPFKWCNESFKQADYVMVVASPYHKHLRLASSVYNNIDVLLLRLLCERLTTRGSKTQFFTLLLPYCSEGDVHAEAINLRRFSFPADLDRLLIFLHREWKLPECLSPAVKGGREDLAMWGKELTCFVEQAAGDLQKNQRGYRAMTEERPGSGEAAKECVEHRKEDCCEFNSHGMRNKTTLMKLAEARFSEFPGPLDNLALSGDDERESLVGAEQMESGSRGLNLDTLNL